MNNSSLQTIGLTLSDLSRPIGITAGAMSQLSIYFVGAFGIAQDAP